MTLTPSIAVATMTLARDDAEASMLLAALERLSRAQLRVAVTDGGSPEAFITALRQLAGFEVQVVSGRGGLVNQVRASLRLAQSWGPRAIFYTEPDKAEFFEQHLESFLGAAGTHAADGLILASRTPASFETFPKSQQYTEGVLNRLCGEVLGLTADYVYGPFLMPVGLARHIEGIPPDLGWGWRTHLFVLATRLGVRISSRTGEFTCPSSQRWHKLAWIGWPSGP